MSEKKSAEELIEALIDAVDDLPVAGSDTAYIARVDAARAALLARITTLEGRTGFCVDCEARQRRIEKLEAALQSVHDHGYTFTSDFDMVAKALSKEPK